MQMVSIITTSPRHAANMITLNQGIAMVEIEVDGVAGFGVTL
jgi:hypothetical protein